MDSTAGNIECNDVDAPEQDAPPRPMIIGRSSPTLGQRPAESRGSLDPDDDSSARTVTWVEPTGSRVRLMGSRLHTDALGWMHHEPVADGATNARVGASLSTSGN